MARANPPIAQLPPQVLTTYKRLVQFLHEEELQTGDRLPTQADLRELLGRNNYTLGAAMQALVSQGVVSRKTSVGTIVTNLAALEPVPWSVAVMMVNAPVDGERSMFANLGMRVQTRLNALGCRCISYSTATGFADSRLSQFGLLAQDVDSGLIDGALMMTPLADDEWQRLRADRRPVVHLPFANWLPGGVVFDQAALVADAVRHFRADDSRSYAIISVDGPDSPHPPRFLQGIAAAGLTASEWTWLDGKYGRSGGARVATELLAAPPADRPDALIVLDDFVTQGLARVLAAQSDYRPQIASLVHRQLPLPYDLPIHAYLVDVEHLVDHAITKLQAHLLRPTLPDTMDYLPGTLQPHPS